MRVVAILVATVWIGLSFFAWSTGRSLPLGYQEQATDEALDAAARLIAEQEAEIARLREEVWRLRTGPNQDTQADGLGNGAPADGPGGAVASGAEGDALPSPDPVGGQPWLKP